MSDQWADLVLFDEAPPPFDDAAVLQVLRDRYAWYFPLLGHRFRCEQIFSHDESRCAGAITSFTADSKPEAEWFASQNPWRRLRAGSLFVVPPDLLPQTSPDPGPSIQRSHP